MQFNPFHQLELLMLSRVLNSAQIGPILAMRGDGTRWVGIRSYRWLAADPNLCRLSFPS